MFKSVLNVKDKAGGLVSLPQNSTERYAFRRGLERHGGATRSGFRHGVSVLFLLACVTSLLCGCASPPKTISQSGRSFDFQKDTFAFPNELVWEYFYDSKGNWTSRRRSPEPTYWLHCFVLARSTRQFFLNARFEPHWPLASEETYKRLIRRVVSSNPRKGVPEDEKVAIPGYPDLRTFSQEQEELLKSECGGAWESYVQRSHWRMIFPFSRNEQSAMAEQLLKDVKQNAPLVVHILRFPQLSINHALVLYDAHETEHQIEFVAYDPNQPKAPIVLAFERNTKTFMFPANHYFPGGRVDVYEIYHKWDY